MGTDKSMGTTRSSPVAGLSEHLSRSQPSPKTLSTTTSLSVLLEQGIQRHIQRQIDMVFTNIHPLVTNMDKFAMPRVRISLPHLCLPPCILCTEPLCLSLQVVGPQGGDSMFFSSGSAVHIFDWLMQCLARLRCIA